MKHTVMQALQPKKYYELLLSEIRYNARELNHHRKIAVSPCEGSSVSVNIEGSVCLLSMTIVPNKNRCDKHPKIELAITGSTSQHQGFLEQVLNEQIEIKYKDEVPKVKLIVVAHTVSNNGNIETAIISGLPALISKFSENLTAEMSDEEPPLSISTKSEFKAIKVGLVFKDKICTQDNLYIVVDPDKDEEDQYIDVEMLVALDQNNKTKVSMHQVSLPYLYHTYNPLHMLNLFFCSIVYPY